MSHYFFWEDILISFVSLSCSFGRQRKVFFQKGVAKWTGTSRTEQVGLIFCKAPVVNSG